MKIGSWLIILLATTLLVSCGYGRLDNDSPFENAGYFYYESEKKAYLIFDKVRDFDGLDAWVDIEADIQIFARDDLKHPSTILFGVPVLLRMILPSTVYVELSRATVYVSSKEDEIKWRNSLSAARRALSIKRVEGRAPAFPVYVAPPAPKL